MEILQKGCVSDHYCPLSCLTFSPSFSCFLPSSILLSFPLSLSQSGRCVSARSLQLWLFHWFSPPSIFPSLAPRAPFCGQAGSYGGLSWGLLFQPRQLCSCQPTARLPLSKRSLPPTRILHLLLAVFCRLLVTNLHTVSCLILLYILSCCRRLSLPGWNWGGEVKCLPTLVWWLQWNEYNTNISWPFYMILFGHLFNLHYRNVNVL